MRKTVLGVALLSLLASPAFAQNKQDPTASPGTSVNESQLPKNQLPSANTGTQVTPPPAAGTRALTPGQNPDGTPRSASPGNAPQLPGQKGN